jgi:hypothetical protein
MEGQKKSGSDLQQCINWLHIELPKRFKEAPKSNEIRWLFSIELHDERRLRCALCAACLRVCALVRACVGGWLGGRLRGWVVGGWMWRAWSACLLLLVHARVGWLACWLLVFVCFFIRLRQDVCVCVFC